MTKSKIQEIEEEINNLTKKRAMLFDEWAKLVKNSDRQEEFQEAIDENYQQKADDLLKEQKEISRQIMRLLKKADDLSVEFE